MESFESYTAANVNESEKPTLRSTNPNSLNHPTLPNYNSSNQISKLELINSFLQYIYISLRSYPPPDIVTIKFNSSENININTICKAIANKLNIPVLDVIFGCTRYSDSKFEGIITSKSALPSSTAPTCANLILTDKDIEKLIENNIIPFIKPDYSTII
jgi:hypothetical protein